LVELLREQPEKGLALLLERYGKIIHFLAYKYSRSPEDREDLHQEIVFELLEDGCRRLRRWEPGRAPLPSYLFLVVRHICRNYCRKVDRVRRHLVRSGHGEDDSVPASGSLDGVQLATQRTSAALSEAVDRLEACLRALIEAGAAREEDRVLVALRAEGHPAKAVADFLGLEEDLVNLRYSRVRRRLAECLSRHGIKSVEDLVTDLGPVKTIYG
jgi:RNA polymerase sigma factor (sigma-70 family)